jgi:UDPglucose 6-dehydrogenase
MKKSVSVVGLGKLGSGLAAVFADAGLRTIGVDVSDTLVRSINAGQTDEVEADKQELIRKHGGKELLATTSHAEAIEKTDISFLMVGTPSDEAGHFSNDHLQAALMLLAQALARSKKSYHLFVIGSTVTPNAIDGKLIPLIERHSGRKLNQGFGICYDPEFVALGEVVRGFREPDVVIIGESDQRAGDEVEKIHRHICANKPAFRRMSIANAEVAKVALNVFLTLKISFGNLLSRLCEAIPGADCDVISDAIGQDRRISPRYLRGGLSFGGPCFPRDTRALAALLQRHDVETVLIDAVNRLNEIQDSHLLQHTLVASDSAAGGAVGVLGLSFKPGTSVISDSAAMTLIQGLLRARRRVIVYDPHAIEPTRAKFGNRIDYAGSASECLSLSRVCVVLNAEPEYSKAVQEYHGAGSKTVIDCWRYLSNDKLPSTIRCIDLGRGRQPAASAVSASAKAGCSYDSPAVAAPAEMARSED